MRSVLPSSSRPPPTQLPCLITPGAAGVLSSVKNSTSKNHFQRFLNLYSITSTLSQRNKLTSQQINDSQTNFNLLKFEPTDDGVHFKVLARSFFHQKIFNSLDAAIEFIETVFNHSKYISFQELFSATKSTTLSGDSLVKDSIFYYLIELGKGKEQLLFPVCSQTDNRQRGGGRGGRGGDESRVRGVFAKSAQDGEKSYRLTLIPRQKQNVIQPLRRNGGNKTETNEEEEHEQDGEDSVSIDLQNYSLRKSSNKKETSVSMRMRQGLEDEDSGYSYRRNCGAKCSSVKIIKHSG
jgi:hypothetical protein